MKARHLCMALVLGSGLALLWVVGGARLPTASAAVARSAGQGVVLSPGAVLTVCLEVAGTCPYTNVQAAVDAADPGDVIKVAAGMYTGVSARPAAPGYNGPSVVTQVVYISKTVTVRGGYTTDFADPPAPEANQTTLDGQGQGRVLYIAGDISPTIEGLRITGGRATGLKGGYGARDAGGGAFIFTATATISDCKVYSNTAGTAAYGRGGGLCLYKSDALLIGNTIFSNTASVMASYGWGGGVDLDYSPAMLNDNTIAGNTASTQNAGWGGGLYALDSGVTMVSNTVRDNRATTQGSGYGGGVYLSGSDGTVLSGNVFVSNTANIAGYGMGGGLYLDYSAAVLDGNTVQGNVASRSDTGRGGGLYLIRKGVSLHRNTIVGNVGSTVSDGYGGGLYGQYCAATLDGNLILSNTASAAYKGFGGGLYFDCSAPVLRHHSAGLARRQNPGAPFTMTNNVVADNHASIGGSGLWVVGEYGPASGRLLHTTIADNRGSGQAVSVGQGTTLAFTNTIIAGHHGVGITVTAGSTVTLEATLWYNDGPDTGGGGHIYTGTVNVYQDPAFVNPATWDYHLRAGSEAIDRGVVAGVTTDMDGDLRPIGPLPDIGADEWWMCVYLPLVLCGF